MASIPPNDVLSVPLNSPLAAPLETPEEYAKRLITKNIPLLIFSRFTTYDPFSLEGAGLDITTLTPIIGVNKLELKFRNDLNSDGLQVSLQYMQALRIAGSHGILTVTSAVDSECLVKLQKCLKRADPSWISKAVVNWAMGVATDGLSELRKFGWALLSAFFAEYEGEVTKVDAKQLLAVIREGDQFQLYERVSDVGEYMLFTRELRLCVKSGEMEWIYLLAEQKFKSFQK